jgi:hypothetical protein
MHHGGPLVWRGAWPPARPQYLAGIHDVLRIERALDGAHEVELRLRTVVAEFVELVHADAVFCRDRTAHGGDEIVHGPRDRGRVLGQRLLVHTFRPHEGEMQIAVADVPIANCRVGTKRGPMTAAKRRTEGVRIPRVNRLGRNAWHMKIKKRGLSTQPFSAAI